MKRQRVCDSSCSMRTSLTRRMTASSSSSSSSSSSMRCESMISMKDSSACRHSSVEVRLPTSTNRCCPQTGFSRRRHRCFRGFPWSPKVIMIVMNRIESMSLWRWTVGKISRPKVWRDEPSMMGQRCGQAKFQPLSNGGDIDFTIAILIFLCAFATSIQVTRAAAAAVSANTRHLRYPQYSREQSGWPRHYDTSLMETPPTGRASGKHQLPPAAAAAAVPDYYDYETQTSGSGSGGPRSRSGFRYGARPEESSPHGLPVSGPAFVIKCYSCDYLNDWNHGQGLLGCLDPFVPKNIPTVECAGPCAKIYRKLEGKDDYFLSRNCMPNCKELMRLTEKGSYTECCSHNLCNQATVHRMTSHNCVILFLLSAIALFILT